MASSWSTGRPDLRAIARLVTDRRTATGLSIEAAAIQAGLSIQVWASIEGSYGAAAAETYQAVGEVLGGDEVTSRILRLARVRAVE